MGKWFWILSTSIVIVSVVSVISILFFRENFLTLWQNFVSRDQTTFQLYGIVKDWDSSTGTLLITSRAGGEARFQIKLDETALITFGKDAKGELEQVLVKNYRSNDWKTAFCVDDGVLIEFTKNAKGDFPPTSFTDQGPRICR